VHPANNGIVSGLTGASGNLGGIIYNLVFRFNGTNYPKAYWIIGTISLVLPVSVSWVRAPKVLPILRIKADFSCLEKLVGWANLVKDISEGS